MHIDLGPLRASLGRRPAPTAPARSRGSTEAAADMAALNAPILEHLRTLSPAELSARVAAVSHPALESAADHDAARAILQREGIVVIPSYFDVAALAPALERIAARLDPGTPVGAAIAEGRTLETPEMLVQGAEARLTRYADLAAHPVPVVTVRQGADQGMIDVFNVDRLAGDMTEAVRAPFANPWLVKLLSAYGEDLAPTNLNLYLNRAITRTRGFHVDNFETNLKSFVYLGDVPDLDHGPYCFVRGTQRDDAWRAANRALATALGPHPTETPFVDPARVVPVVAGAGALIVSDQSGAHRGLPQSPDAERRVLVMRYM
ncbi:MAG: hypothetical protein ACU0CO_03630 [Shimia sp.]